MARINTIAGVPTGGDVDVTEITTDAVSGDMLFHDGSTLDDTDNLSWDETANTLTVSGPSSNLAAMPRLSFAFDGDDDPGFSYVVYNHDSIGLLFDAYHNGTDWISSDVGSNFALYKNTDALSIWYSSGNAKNGTLTWSTGGFKADKAGNASVGVPLATAIDAKFKVYDNTTGATNPCFYVHQDHASNTGYATIFQQDGTGSTLQLYANNTSRTGHALYLSTRGTGGDLIYSTSVEDSANASIIEVVRKRGTGVAGQDGDKILNIKSLAYNDAGTPEQIEFARLSTSIVDASDGTEGGALALSTMAAGSLTETLRCDSGVVGIGSGTPNAYSEKLTIWDNQTGATNPVLVVKQDHASNTGYAAEIIHDGSGAALKITSSNTSSSNESLYITRANVAQAAIYLFSDGNSATASTTVYNRRRNSGVAGQDADGIHNLVFNAYNDAGTPEKIEFARISTSIVDASDGTEGGGLALKVANGTDGSLLKMVEASSNNLGFYGVTPTAQASLISDPSGGGTQDAEARTAINAILDLLENVGLMANA